MKNKLMILFLLLVYTLRAQYPIDELQICNAKKLDMQIIKGQSYLKFAEKDNCDSLKGTSMSERITANLELQKQDSLLC